MTVIITPVINNIIVTSNDIPVIVTAENTDLITSITDNNINITESESSITVGEKLEVGVRGLSAYQVAVQNGFIGTEQEWLESLQGSSGAQSFESFSKNLNSSPFVLNYVGEQLNNIVYATDQGQATKSFDYDDDGLLTMVTLSGAVPTGIATIKTIAYNSGLITSIIYT